MSEGEREVGLPGPAGGHPECHCPGGAGNPAGDRQQSLADRARRADGGLGQPDLCGPSEQVVRERGDHRPGRVGKELAGREVRQGLVFEVADRELHDRVLAMLRFDDLDRVGPVGQKRVVAPVGPELGLGSQESGAAHDQPLGAEHRLRDLRLPSLRVVLEGLPVLLGDRGDCGLDVLLLASADRIRPTGALQTAHDLVVPESRVCAQQLRPGRPGPRDARDQFFDEAQRPARGVRRALPGADVQYLAGPRAGREDRVIAALVGVAVAGALLVIAVYLADEAVDVDDEALTARAGTSRPGAPETVGQHPIELADMPERERTQKRAQCRRRRNAMTEDSPRLTRAQQITVLDAIRSERHRT